MSNLCAVCDGGKHAKLYVVGIYNICLGTRLYLRCESCNASTIRVSAFSALVSFQLKRPLPPIGYTTANHNSVATAPAAASHTSPESPALIFEFWILVGSELIENAWTAQTCPEDCIWLDFLRCKRQLVAVTASCRQRESRS